jgi:hypothetical protein
MSEEGQNPAGRLHELLKSARNNHGGAKAGHVWAKCFKLPWADGDLPGELTEEQLSDVIDGLAVMLQLIDETEAGLRASAVSELYLQPFPLFRRLVHVSLMNPTRTVRLPSE